MPGEAADLEQAARDYGELLPDPLDLLLLGIGEDGHTASLFPGSPALGERSARVVVVTGPKPPNPRLSITPPVIEAAREILRAGERGGEGRGDRARARGAARRDGGAGAARAAGDVDRGRRRRGRPRRP